MLAIMIWAAVAVEWPTIGSQEMCSGQKCSDLIYDIPLPDDWHEKDSSFDWAGTGVEYSEEGQFLEAINHLTIATHYKSESGNALFNLAMSLSALFFLALPPIRRG